MEKSSEEIRSFESVLTVIEEQAIKNSGDNSFGDLAKLVDLKKVVKGLSVQTGEDFDNKEFANICIPQLIVRTLNNLSVDIEEPTKLKESVKSARVRLESKVDEVTARVGKMEKFTKEEIENLEEILFKSYSQIIVNKISDRIILSNVGMIETLLRTIKDLDLIQ